MAFLHRQDFRLRTALLAGFSALALGACSDLPGGSEQTGARASGTLNIGGPREVEAPDAYATEARALWDGRPSFGGVWIAAPDVTTPEQVRIENLANGQVIKAALYRRERDLPGPKIQVSMDAAKELGMQAGAAVDLRVVAIRKEEVAPPAPVANPEPLEGETIVASAGAADAALVDAADGTEPAVIAVTEGEALPEITASTEIASLPVGDVGAEVPTLTTATVDAMKSTRSHASEAVRLAAASAIEARALAAATEAGIVSDADPADPIDGDLVAATLAATPATTEAAAQPAAEPLKYPFIQVATAASEALANDAIARLKAAGLEARSRQSGDSFGIVVGPLTSAQQQTAALAKVKELGYGDAFLTK